MQFTERIRITFTKVVDSLYGDKSILIRRIFLHTLNYKVMRNLLNTKRKEWSISPEELEWHHVHIWVMNTKIKI